MKKQVQVLFLALSLINFPDHETKSPSLQLWPLTNIKLK